MNAAACHRASPGLRAATHSPTWLAGSVLGEVTDSEAGGNFPLPKYLASHLSLKAMAPPLLCFNHRPNTIEFTKDSADNNLFPPPHKI